MKWYCEEIFHKVAGGFDVTKFLNHLNENGVSYDRIRVTHDIYGGITVFYFHTHEIK